MAVSIDPNDPNFGLETDPEHPDFGLSPKEDQAQQPALLAAIGAGRSGAQMDSLAAREIAPSLQTGVEAVARAVPEAVKGAQTAQTAVLNPASYVSDALTPKPVKEFMQTPIVSPETMGTVRQAAQYPVQTLSQILFGTGGVQEKPNPVSRFIDEQLAGQTTPENLAVIAGTMGLGAAESVLAKRAPSVAEILFGRGQPPVPRTALTESVAKTPLPVPGEYDRRLLVQPERRFQMVDEPKPEVAPVRPITEQVRYLPTSRAGEQPPLAPEAFPSILQSAEEARRTARTVETGIQSETAKIGEPNASKIESPTQTNGGVRTRSELQELPQGNVEATDARLRGNIGEETTTPRQGTETQPAQETVATVPTEQQQIAPNEPLNLRLNSEQVAEPSVPVSQPTETTTAQPLTGEIAKPPVQTTPESGISTERLQNLYGEDAVLITKGRSPQQFKAIGLADKRDPYAVLSKAQQAGIAHPDDVPVLRVEHQRLLEKARAAYGTPEYNDLAKQAVDFANATKQVAHGPASDIMRSVQEADKPSYDSPADFDNIVRERMNRESTPQEKEVFQKASNDVKNGNGEVRKVVDDAEQRLAKYRPKETMKFEEAVDRIRTQIKELTKDCVL